MTRNDSNALAVVMCRNGETCHDAAYPPLLAEPAPPVGRAVVRSCGRQSCLCPRRFRAFHRHPGARIRNCAGRIRKNDTVQATGKRPGNTACVRSVAYISAKLCILLPAPGYLRVSAVYLTNRDDGY